MQRLSNLDSRTLAIWVIALTVVVGGLWYFFWYKPAKARVADLNQQIENLERQRRIGLAAKRALPELRSKIAQLEAEIQSFLAALPEEEKFYEVLDLLSDNAVRTGVTLVSLSRSRSQSQIENVRSIDVALRMEAPFPELYAYLKQLEKLKRYSSINGVNLSLAGQGQEANPRINANLTVRFYVYRGPKPGGGE